MKNIKRIISGILIILILAVSVGSDIGPMSSVEAVSANSNGSRTSSKKGIFLSMGTDVIDLGVSEVYMQIELQKLFTTETSSDKATSFQYGDKTYYFDAGIISNWDNMIKILTANNITVNVGILNTSFNKAFPDLYYPGVNLTSGVKYYGLNTSTEAGKNMVEAAMHFVASRYNGGQYGLISNYIVGNEVNLGKMYNYMGAVEIDEFTQKYYQTFKTVANAVKKENSSAKIYTCVTGRWNQYNDTIKYSSRDFLTKFNALAKADGTDWGLGFHAYSYPLDQKNILRDGEEIKYADGRTEAEDIVRNSEDTLMITMKNLNILTDFMQKSEMLDSNGNVRSIILSEQGFTSNMAPWGDGTNETVQAANIAYAYYVAEMNPYIDSFILNGETDVAGDDFKIGLWNVDSNNNAVSKKLAWNMYKYIDTDQSLAVTEFAKKTLGIDDWSKAVRYWDDSKIPNKKAITNGQILKVDNVSQAAGTNILSSNVNSGYWTLGFNTFGTSIHSKAGAYYPDGLIIMNQYASNLLYQQFGHKYITPLDASSTPYIGIHLKLIGNESESKYSTPQTEEVRIRVTSGDKTYDANTAVTTGTDNVLFVNLSDWAGKNSIDNIEIWTQEQGTDTNFDGVIEVKEFLTASSLTGATTLSTNTDTTMKTLTADPVYALETPYDYSQDVYIKKFDDVAKTAFYYDAVNWAVKNGVTNGKNATTFAPTESCTRGQVVTFLWRAVGSPEPSSTTSPFTDVQNSSSFYYKAVLWAAEQGITKGTTATTFSPDAEVTRADFVTFLYRAKKATPVEGTNPFTDVEAGKYYYNPILWAYVNGVTKGLNATTFGTKTVCNRSQVVTFIYRAYGN